MGESNKAGETRQEIIPDWNYLEKRQFVKKLEEALLCLDEIRGVEYRASNEVSSDEGYSDDGCIEWVRIDWHGARDPHIYTDVTANSLRQILDQVVLMVLYGRPDFRIRNKEREDEHWADKLWDKLGEVKIHDPIYEEKGEDHYGKLPSDAASVLQEVRKRCDELEGEGSYEKDSKSSLKGIVDGESNNAEEVTQEMSPDSIFDVERKFVRELSDALIYLRGCERKDDD